MQSTRSRSCIRSDAQISRQQAVGEALWAEVEVEQKYEDDIISLVLQGKREYETVLQLNDSLRSQCHALQMKCDMLKEDNEGLHAGILRSPLTPSTTAFVRIGRLA